MVQIKDFEFSVMQQGEPVSEHEDVSTHDTENAQTLYAEVVEDNNFQLRVVCNPRLKFGTYQALLVNIAVDGHAVNGKCYPRRILVPGQPTILLIRDLLKAVHRKTLVQSFRFEESETRPLSQDETFDGAREAFKAQGTIEISVSRAQGSFSTNNREMAESAEIRYPKDIVKEKGSTTCIKYDNEERTTNFDTFETTLAEEPIATVVYKYRTLEVLRDLQVVKSRSINTGAGEVIEIPDDEGGSDDEVELIVDRSMGQNRLTVEDGIEALDG